jgi:hypothetical protein
MTKLFSSVAVLAALFVLQSGSADAAPYRSCMSSPHKAVRAACLARMKRGGDEIKVPGQKTIVVSPYVPGSKQDKAWKAERKRLGLD